MKEQQVEQVTFDDGSGGEEYFLILDRFKHSGQIYVFMLEMKDEKTVLQNEGKPVFLVMREEREDFFDLTKEESEEISLQIKDHWADLNKKIQSLEGYAD